MCVLYCCWTLRVRKIKDASFENRRYNTYSQRFSKKKNISMSIKRIRKELYDLLAAAPSEPMISAAPLDEADLYHWGAAIIGPAGTPYEGGLFKLDVVFSADYPFKPMKMRFVTPIYHPNINLEGYMSLNILSTDWSPALTIGKVLLSIAAVLSDPCPESPMRPDVADQFKKDRAAFNTIATRWTRQYALGL